MNLVLKGRVVKACRRWFPSVKPADLRDTYLEVSLLNWLRYVWHGVRLRPMSGFKQKKDPDHDLLSRALSVHAIIGPGGLNFRVRNGNGCFPPGMVVRVKDRIMVAFSKMSSTPHTVAGGISIPATMWKWRWKTS